MYICACNSFARSLVTTFTPQMLLLQKLDTGLRSVPNHTNNKVDKSVYSSHRDYYDLSLMDCLLVKVQ